MRRSAQASGTHPSHVHSSTHPLTHMPTLTLPVDELMAIFQEDKVVKAADEAGVNAGNQNDMYAFFVRRCR